MVAVAKALAALFPSVTSASLVAAMAGVPLGLVNLSGSPVEFWFNIVWEADKRSRVRALVEAALDEYPDHPALRAYLDEDVAPAEGPKPGADVAWGTSIDGDGLERIMSSQSTFLPIRFLEAGMAASRSVARVVLADGSSGTGFLTARSLLVTNHHVIPSVEVARGATVEFNYQETVAGSYSQVTRVALTPDDGFVTSEQHDVSVVRVSGDTNATWGEIEVAPRVLDGLKWVNIIQHPGGGPKQVALYHNLVCYVDDNYVQYFTDTMPGSSGSPVFDSNWDLVAIHHSGGWIREPNTPKPVFRNEGINVARIADLLAEVPG